MNFFKTFIPMTNAVKMRPHVRCIRPFSQSASEQHSHSHSKYDIRSRLACWKCGSSISGSSHHSQHQHPHSSPLAKGKDTPTFFCPNLSCQVIQPPNTHDSYFDLFFPSMFTSLEDVTRQGYNIHLVLLKRRFLDLVQKLHPDYFGRKSKEERDLSEEQSALLNKAYQTLLDPLSRAVYILSLNDITLPESTSGTSGPDPMFLMEVMELSEQVEDASSEEDLSRLKAENDERIKYTTVDIRNAFEKMDLESAVKATQRLKYWKTIETSIHEKVTSHHHH